MPGTTLAPEPAPALSVVACPNQGLRPYGAAERERFFGRGHVVATLLDRIKPGPLTAVLGASGAGKSSVLAAGIGGGARKQCVQPAARLGQVDASGQPHRTGRCTLPPPFMLTSLNLEGWKSFGKDRGRSELIFAPLTLLVGPNASGKSNALDALRFLQGAALDYPLGDVLRGRWEGQREIWPAIRGSVVEASHVGRTSFKLTSTWMLEGHDIEHKIGVSTRGDVALDEERLSWGGYLFDTHAPALRDSAGRDKGGGIRAALRRRGKGNSVTLTYSSLRSLLGQIEDRESVISAVPEVAQLLRRALRAAVFLDIQPAVMREYRPQNGGHLGSSGENISPVLAALSREELADVVDWLSELCAPEIETIDFDRTKLREVMMILVERGGRQTSARSASDGTLRFLGELVALLTSPPGTLIVLEEPDVGLHPSRIRLLAELLEQIVSKRQLQVIATTHSPTLLAHLSQKALGDVIGFGRDRETGDTICSRLEDLSHFATLRDAKNIEHLLSTGWLERAL